jgi:hypothetical protein
MKTKKLETIVVNSEANQLSFRFSFSKSQQKEETAIILPFKKKSKNNNALRKLLEHADNLNWD